MVLISTICCILDQNEIYRQRPRKTILLKKRQTATNDQFQRVPEPITALLGKSSVDKQNQNRPI